MKFHLILALLYLGQIILKPIPVVLNGELELEPEFSELLQKNDVQLWKLSNLSLPGDVRFHIFAPHCVSTSQDSLLPVFCWSTQRMSRRVFQAALCAIDVA